MHSTSLPRARRAIRLLIATASIVLVALVVHVVPAPAAPGALDRSWGSGGLGATTDGRHLSLPAPGSLVQLPDGKLLTAGVHTTFGFNLDDLSFSFRLQPTVTRSNPDGTLDATWGAGGVASPYLQDHMSAGVRAVPTPDGGVVLVGAQLGILTARTFVAKLDARGALDPAFGSGGSVVTLPEALDDLVPVAATVLADGRIEVVATSFQGDLAQLFDGGVAHPRADLDVALVRYLPSGALDPSFGTGGFVQFDSRNGASNDIALEASFAPDGSVVVGGLTWYSAERTTALLARFTATGAVDDTYGYHGVAGVTGSDARAIEAVTALSPIATDGSVTVAVEHTRNASGDGPDAPVQPFVRRFSAAGTRVAFGRNPLGAALPIGSLATTIASTGDGAVLLGGSAPIAGEEANALVGAVMRLTPGGRLDGTFDRAGIAIPVDGGTGLRQGIVTGLAVQADGSILAAGAWNGVARIARLFGSSAGGAGQARPVVTERVLRGAPRAGCGARARSACLATGIVTVQVQVRGVAATEAVVRVGPASGPISVDRRITVHLDAHGRGTARIHVADDQESDTFGVHAWIAATASSQSAVSPTLFLVRPPTADDTAPVGATRPAPPNRVAAACALARRSSGAAALDARFACAAARR